MADITSDPRIESLFRKLEEHPGVRQIALTGSRARGDSTPLSDWDFVIETDDFPGVSADIEAIASVAEPIGALWDPLSERECYMLILSGPVKVDLIFPERPAVNQPPWTVTASTLPLLDAHFWDWTLWLTSKQLRGKQEFVTRELEKMYRHLLAPMGCRETPRSLDSAVAYYRHRRGELERALRVSLAPTLDSEVQKALDRLRFLT